MVNNISSMILDGMRSLFPGGVEVYFHVQIK